MNTLTKAPTRIKVTGAVLAIAALATLLLAVIMTAGPTMAQVEVDPGDLPVTGDNEDYYDDPLPCSEEAQPDASTAPVIPDPTDDSTLGYYAVFDAFWDYEVGHLSNNFCPPAVKYTPAQTGGLTPEPAKYERSNANIHISETAFSVPTSYKVTVVDSDEANGNPSTATEPKIDLADYQFLRGAVSAVKPGPDSTEANPTTVFADNSIWWVRLDDPDTTGNDETSDLQIGFSTALLKDEHWYRPDGEDSDTDPDPPVQFQFGAVHVLQAGVPVEAHVVGANFFAFDKKEANTPLAQAAWSNLDTATHSEINMFTDKYLPLQFAFTQPGVYLVQAHVQGHVRQEASWDGNVPDGWKPIHPDATTITSPVEWYTFHVGPEADLSVTLTHTDETADDDTTTVTDGTASFSVTATNDGPDTAEGVVVEVSLPVGLDYVADASHTGVTFECGVISWAVGDLNKDASNTLNFTASVGTGAAKTLTADAEVHSSTVDDNETNDTASVDVKTNSTVVTAPVFPGVTRSIVEHALEGTHAGEPVAALNPDGRQLTYSLEGRCASWFNVHNNGQVVLGANRTLDYDKQSEFHLTLRVSDGVNADGNTDTAIDDSTPLTIKVIDGLDDVDHPTISFHLANPDPSNLDISGTPPLSLPENAVVSIVPTIANPPEGTVNFHWDIITNGVSGEQRYFTGSAGAGAIRTGPGDIAADTSITYKLHVSWEGGGITDSYIINWTAN